MFPEQKSLKGAVCPGLFWWDTIAWERALRVVTEPEAKYASSRAIAYGNHSAQVTGGAVGKNQVPKLH